MHKDLVSIEMLSSLCYDFCTINMVSPQVRIVYCSIDSKEYGLAFSINYRGLSKSAVEAMHFLVGPGNEKVRTSSEQKVVLIDHLLESLAVAILV